MKDDPRFSGMPPVPQIDLDLGDPAPPDAADPALLAVTSAPGPLPISTGLPPEPTAAPDLPGEKAPAEENSAEPPPAAAPPRTGPATPYPYRDPTQRGPARRAPTTPQPALTPAPPPPAVSKPARVRRPVPRGWWVLGGVLALALLVLSWTHWPVRAVEISGNSRVAAPELRRLAGLEGQFGWLYYGAWKARGLVELPWVKTATVTRQFPATVRIAVTERQPFARWQKAEGQVALLAEDGAELPAAPGVNLSGTGALPLIGGWGPPRLADALRLTRALSRYTVQSVTYTPSGFTVQTASGTAWGGDLNTLVKYAGSIGMYPNRQIYIYPWGVSVQE